MTIIVGIECSDSIVLASDSQTTDAVGTSKRCDSFKIASANFKQSINSDRFGEQTILIAQSGDAVLTSRWIELLTEIAKERTIDDRRSPAQCAEDALRKLKEDIIQPLLPASAEERKKIFDSYSPSLMLAFFFDGQSNLFTIDFSLGIANRRHKYALMGCGSTVGEFILSQFDNTSRMQTAMALTVAVYVVEEVKKVDAFCGGTTRLAYIAPPVVTVIGEIPVQEIVAELTKVRKGIQNDLSQKMLNTIFPISEKWRGLLPGNPLLP